MQQSLGNSENWSLTKYFEKTHLILKLLLNCFLEMTETKEGKTVTYRGGLNKIDDNKEMSTVDIR